MRIKSLELKNFRSFPKTSFQFNDINNLSGKNGVGKTTIKEAIVFALYGRDLSGTNLNLDSQIKTGEAMAIVKAEFDKFTIIRYKSRGKSKVLFSDTPSVEPSEVAQRDFESILPEPVLFQSIFDVGYFMSLPEKTQKLILLENSIPLNLEEIAKKEYPWLSTLKTKIPVIFGDYEQERKRFLKIRNSRRANLAEKTGELKAINSFTSETEEEIKTTGIKISELRSLPNDVKRCDKCHQFLPNRELDLRLSELRRLENLWSDLINRKNQKLNSAATLESEISELKQEIEEFSMIIDMLGPTGLPAIEMDLKLKPIVEFLSKRIPGFEIKTKKEIKTTLEEENTFLVTVGGKPYSRLSTGEQLKVDIAISETLDKLSNKAINMFFIDKVESLSTKPKRIEGQTFIATVTNGSKLKVESMSHEKRNSRHR